MTLQLPDLTLRRGEDRRLRAGHPWVFSNEVDNDRTPLKAFAPGEPVCLRAADGRPVGTAYVNPHSLICARLMSRDPDRAPDGSLLVHRLNLALSLRERLFDAPYYRLVHGEGDGLPGLVVDRFGDTLVAQINTAGMERLREALVEALHRVLRPRHILLRCDSAMRELEGLERYIEWAGDAGPDTLDVAENGARFTVPASAGQKTGWYYDHTANRARMMPLVAGRRVLDLYGYVGAWGIEAALAGAAGVLTVDASRDAAEWAGRNAGWNGVDDRVSVACGDVLEVLAALREDRERFDVVIADPPAFIKRRKDHRQGLRAYRRLNQAAMQVLAHDGVLISASCSAHLERDELRSTLLAAGRHLDRSLQIVDFGRQGPDHPVHPALPETDYIKVITARVLPADSQI
ncbi:class I SAM-dependent rRNA methyltransferase [Spiribacter halobius]|uniref:RlmI/RlmK family 23S rRNA methyltransferase n=1 Tax=Sediminicurvatus halobius TaxID=2182432 RepID=A0A2U2N1S1_9GAMM|nr:class I SAM-dependent rRNA methyltransferase [Spiribacter halobius]PWG63008.1 RlmI/RlmK family 23S rRNA methyltransferase [Spiribacter halobius]UEX77494.1 class I SAM-dependent rRNA methyltransferase [Spiribacter halobius]